MTGGCYFGDGVGLAIGNANVDVGDAPGEAGAAEAEADGVGLGVGVGVGLGSGGVIFFPLWSGTVAPPISFSRGFQRAKSLSRSGGPDGGSAGPRENQEGDLLS